MTDKGTGYGVMGAEVFLDRTRWRTVTDTTGRYTLSGIDTGTYTLNVRRLGYVKQSRQVIV